MRCEDPFPTISYQMLWYGFEDSVNSRESISQSLPFPNPPNQWHWKKGDRLQKQLNRLTSKARQQGFLFLFFFSFNLWYWKIGIFFSKQIENLLKFSTFMGQIFTLWPCHLHLKSILRQKKNYGNSNISPSKNILFHKKNPPKETKILQDIITL